MDNSVIFAESVKRECVPVDVFSKGKGSSREETHWFLLGGFLSWSAVTLAEKL